MYKRRDIRETAVQFLYFSDLEEGADPSGMQSTFWHIIQETSLLKLVKAKAKAVLHLSQGRTSRMEKLADLVPLALADLKAAGNFTALTVPLRTVLRTESKLSAAIELLRTSIQSQSGESLIEPRLAEVYIANHVAEDARDDFQAALQNSPTWRNKLEAITAACNHLERISERIDALENIESATSPAHGFEHLHATSSEIQAFRNDTEELVQGILKHKESIDKKLSDIVENYSPSRVAPVDRAILRLGTYEILHCDDIPRAVSINEAIEIAKKFGSTESARFINGILDAL
jgi:N utilization substance protein B